MEITTDASILIAVVGHEPSRGRAIELTTGHSLVAPGSIHWEVGNALSAMVKRERITLAQAAACLDAYLQIPIKLVDVDLKQSMGLVKQFRMYAYDAYVLVCALHLGTPLLSLDVPLKAAARSLGIEVLEV
jgi:predicted nucleic acid-binding protein